MRQQTWSYRAFNMGSMPEMANPGAPKRPQPPTSPISLQAGARLEVFLSHATADREPVHFMRRQIEALGIDAYLAEHDSRPGTSIAAKVDEALRHSHAVVVLITTTSINSAYVQQEVGLARAYGKPIIPIVEKDVDTTNLGMLGEVQWLKLDLTEPAEALADLTSSLRPLVLSQV